MESFHLAFGVTDLEKTIDFYTTNLGCTVGRSTDAWIDFNFFGHQLSAHLVEKSTPYSFNLVEGDTVPIPHFGVILNWDHWHQLVERLEKVTVKFIIEPKIRFENEVGEQATVFLSDPSGNVLEFKSFKNPDDVFAN